MGRVSSILHVIRSPRSVTNWIWSWLDWLEKFCLSSNFSFWLSSNFRTDFSFPFVFQRDLWRGRGDMYTFSYMTSPVPTSLKGCQSFLNRKIDVDPKYRVLMFLPCIVQILCTTWFIEVNLYRILMPFVHRINRQEEYCLSLARILTSKY